MGSRGSSPPRGNGQRGKDSPGGSSSSSSSSDSDSDRLNQLGDEISKLIRALRKKDSCNRVAKHPEAVFLGKAPKMREPETYEGCRESYVPWMNAVKEYMTVCSMDFQDDTTKIYWLGSSLKGEARNWHQNRLATAEKELQPDTWATYKAAMDYHFRDPHEKRTFTNKMANLYWKGTCGHTKTGLSADQWGIRIAMYQEKAQCDGKVLKEIYMRAFTKELSNQAWRVVQYLDNPKYEILKAKLVELGTADEEHESMHQKPLLRIYQNDQSKQDKDKKKEYGDKRKSRSSEARGKDREHTRTTKSDKERKFQNNRDALSGIPQNEIDQHKADKGRCGRNSHHTLECFVKKTSKGTELATPVAAIRKKGK
jgi:hypothetical protein